MKKLHILIFKTFLGPFISTFFITLFILVMQFLWVYIDEMVGKGLSFGIISELLFYASASLVPLALPLAVLLSSIMTFGNLGEHYELVALKSSGLSLQRIMFPLIIFMVLLSFGAFVFSNSIWPTANLKFASLLYDIRKKKPALDIKDNVYYKEIEGFVIRVKNRNEKTDLLEDVFIYDHTDKKGNTKIIRAETGRMDMTDDQMGLKFELNNGNLYSDEEGKKYPYFRQRFEKKTITFDLSGFELERSDQEVFANNYRMMNLMQIIKQIDTVETFYGLVVEDFSYRMSKDIYFLNEEVDLAAADTNTQVAYQPNWFQELNKNDRIKYLNLAINITRASNSFAAGIAKGHNHRKKNIRSHYIEIHRKFTLAFACLILFFIGAPLGAIIRKGGLGMPVVISVLFFLLFHITGITGEKMAKGGDLSVFAGMWLSSFVLIPIGMFLTYKATTDSVLLDTEFYKRLFKGFKRFRFLINWLPFIHGKKA